VAVCDQVADTITSRVAMLADRRPHYPHPNSRELLANPACEQIAGSALVLRDGSDDGCGSPARVLGGSLGSGFAGNLIAEVWKPLTMASVRKCSDAMHPALVVAAICDVDTV